MALFQDRDIVLGLDKLRVEASFDRFGGVEPEIIAIFFKIDGHQYKAYLRLWNTQPPEEGTTQVEETTSVQLQLLSEPNSQEPWIYFPPGNIYRPELYQGIDFSNGGLFPDDEMDISYIRCETTLSPIPLCIDVGGLFDLADISDILPELPIVSESIEEDPIDLLNTLFVALSTFVANVLGLDEEIDGCPAFDLDELLNQIEAQFNCLIPGTIGGVFVVMENDDFGEDDLVVIRDTITNEIVQNINDITNSVTRINPIPETEGLENQIDRDKLMWDIAKDLLFRFDPQIWLAATVGEIYIGSQDDVIGDFMIVYDHLTLPAESTDFSESVSAITTDGYIWVPPAVPVPIQGGNRWTIHGKLEI